MNVQFEVVVVFLDFLLNVSVTNSKLKLFGPNLVVVDFDLKLKLDGGK